MIKGANRGNETLGNVKYTFWQGLKIGQPNGGWDRDVSNKVLHDEFGDGWRGAPKGGK